jgi:2-keto-3-deoxy-L-rhamnonate aldolase RhmA
VPWIIEASGFDYCMIDHEHGAFNIETIADFAGWFRVTNERDLDRDQAVLRNVWTQLSVR